MKLILCLSLLFSLSTGCADSNEKNPTRPEIANADPVQAPGQDNIGKAYFASGCFWCVEAIYENVKGVEEAVSGYAGGHTKNPTYESTNTGRTGHAETVEVVYDPAVIDFDALVAIYFGSQNPTQKNGQGPDIGPQYRSIIFYQDEEQKKIIEKKKEAVQKNHEKEIAAEILPFQKFWKAEEYHQDYEKRHPENPYIQQVSVPRINKFKEKFPHLLKNGSHN